LRGLSRHPERLTGGWPFALTLIGILSAHELGHYAACRFHGVRSSLPWVLPAPTLIGTFGAFIRLRSRVPSRMALLDIGVAGPLAGMLVAIPALISGLILSHHMAAPGLSVHGQHQRQRSSGPVDCLYRHCPPLPPMRCRRWTRHSIRIPSWWLRGSASSSPQ
jgi:membrane-associated protease RseP (regulator of RpoE activity)